MNIIDIIIDIIEFYHMVLEHAPTPKNYHTRIKFDA